MLDTGVVDQDIDTAIVGADVVQSSFDAFRRGNVNLNGGESRFFVRLCTEQLGDCFFAAGLVARTNKDGVRVFRLREDFRNAVA